MLINIFYTLEEFNQLCVFGLKKYAKCTNNSEQKIKNSRFLFFYSTKQQFNISYFLR